MVGILFINRMDSDKKKTDAVLYTRILLRSILVISCIVFTVNLCKLRYLNKTDSNQNYWCDTYEIPQPVKLAFPIYSERWQTAFEYQKEGLVAEAAAGVARIFKTNGWFFGTFATAVDATADLKRSYSKYQQFNYDVAAGAQLLYRVRDGMLAMKENNLDNWINANTDYTSSKWWAFLRTRISIVLVSTVALTFVMDTIIDQIWIGERISIERAEASCEQNVHDRGVSLLKGVGSQQAGGCAARGGGPPGIADSEKQKQRIGSLLGSLCIAFVISTNMLTVHTYLTRKSAQEIMKAYVNKAGYSNRLKATLQDLEKTFNTDWTKFDIVRMVLVSSFGRGPSRKNAR